MRQSRTSEAPRAACNPSARSCDGARAARSAVVGATCRRSGPSAQIVRMIVCSSRRARLASISWPQNARSIACATVATRSGRSPRRAREARPEHRVVTHRAQEVGMVVVERKDPAQTVDDSRRTGRDRHGPVGRLPCTRKLRHPIDREHGREDAVSERACGIARQACRERERVWPAGSDREFDRQRSERMPSGIARMPNSAARSSTSSASDSWPCSRSSRPQDRAAADAERHCPVASSRSTACL